MPITREIGSRQLLTLAVTLDAQTPWAQLLGSDVERRGAVVYIDPAAPVAAYIADSEQHARAQSSGVPIFPANFPPGLELGVAGGVWVYCTDDDIAGNQVTVYALAEIGQAVDHV